MPRTLRSIHNELLVLRCQEGDAAALEELISRWNARLRAHAWSLTGHAASVDDVCQEAWLAIARGIRRLEDPAGFPGWAYRIVTRRCADWTRARQRERRIEERAALKERAELHTEKQPDESVSRLRHAIQELPASKRSVLNLHYLHGLGVNQIATALDIPSGTVKSRLHTAREELKALLERNDS